MPFKLWRLSTVKTLHNRYVLCCDVAHYFIVRHSLWLSHIISILFVYKSCNVCETVARETKRRGGRGNPSFLPSKNI